MMPERWGAGIPKIVFSAKGRATGVSSHPISYEIEAFTAMAVNRAVSSHPGRVGLTRADPPDSVLARYTRGESAR